MRLSSDLSSVQLAMRGGSWIIFIPILLINEGLVFCLIGGFMIVGMLVEVFTVRPGIEAEASAKYKN